MMAVSLCMITKNEEPTLKDCLESVKGIASEIIIVDTGSTDKTKSIASQYTKQIIEAAWQDSFSHVRNLALQHATKDWILVMDADERMDEQGSNMLIHLAKKGKADAYAFEQRTYLKQQHANCVANKQQHAAEYPFYVSRHLVRLFRNKKGIEFRHRVHEIVEDSIREKKLAMEKVPIVIHHFGSVLGNKSAVEKRTLYGKLILLQVKDNPDNARYQYYAGHHFLEQNNLDKALLHFKKTAALDPSYKLIFSDIAKVFLKKQDTENAMLFFRKSLEFNPDNASPANNLAVLLMQRRHFSEAKQLLEESLQRNPTNQALRINYQQLLKEMEDNRRHVAG